MSDGSVPKPIKDELNVAGMTDSRISASYPEQLREIEHAEIKARRNAAGLCGPKHGPKDFPSDAIGLAISGGGIRSATTGLGFLQALAKQRITGTQDAEIMKIETDPRLDGADRKSGVPLLRRIDFLSTVSGGGYIGSFWGRHYLREDEFGKEKPVTQHTEGLLANHWSKPVYWLRENGRYLTPAGGADYWIAVANWLRNFLMVQILVGAVLLMTIFGVLAAKGVGYALGNGRLGTGVEIIPLSEYYKAADANWCEQLIRVFTLGSKAHVPPPDTLELIHRTLGWSVIAGGVLFLLGFALHYFVIYVQFLKFFLCPSANAAERKARVRRTTAEISRATLVLLLSLIALRAVDLAAIELYSSASATFSAVGAAITAIIGFYMRFSGLKLLGQSGGIAANARKIANAGGFVLLFVYAVTLTALAYWAILPGSKPNESVPKIIEVDKAIWIAAGLFVLNVLLGRLMGFLNHTSLAEFYGSRLCRAYLGASNTKRWTPEGLGVATPEPGDDIAMTAYAPHTKGGPLHLINVTVNDTVSGQSNVTARDRKGLPMAVSALGVTLGVTHHAKWHSDNKSFADLGVEVLEPLPDGRPEDEYRVFARAACTEPLKLSQWVGISGAAFSTGMGANTQTGLAFLLGFIGVRTGHWWKSGSPSRAIGSLGKLGLLIGQKIQACSERCSCCGNTSVEQHDQAREAIRGFAVGNIKNKRTTKGGLDSFLNGSSDRIGGVFKIQAYLLNELSAKFSGPAENYWYLSDGGHYENSGALELIRRQLPFFIVLDNGADPDYDFVDLEILVRRARTDYQADIQFIDVLGDNGDTLHEFSELTEHITATDKSDGAGGKQKKEQRSIKAERRSSANQRSPSCVNSAGYKELKRYWLNEPYKPHDEFWLALEKLTEAGFNDEVVGSLNDLKRPRMDSKVEGAHYSRRHVAVALVRYEPTKRFGVMLWVKPSLNGDEDQDLIGYHNSHPDFPNETTLDQFFDEAQFESYRKLGRHIGKRIARVLASDCVDPKKEPDKVKTPILEALLSRKP